MSLTGDAFYYALIAGTVLMAVLTLLLWSRVPGPGLLRVGQRLVLLMLCQACAIAVAGTWVNNHYGLYASWSDLLGTDTSSHLVMSGPPPQTADFTRFEGGTVSTFFRGPHSRLAGQVIVWTPPQYDEKAYRKRNFPVIELLHGDPGEPVDWIHRSGMPGRLAKLMADGRMKPALVVMPQIMPGGVDTDCSDTPQSKVATWLAQDVPGVLHRHFRVQRAPRAWALVGLSTGGLCAIKLPMQYPKVFGIGAAMNADPFAGDPSILPDSATREANAPLVLARKRPPVQLFAATSAQDVSSPPANIAALAAAVRPPTTLAPPYVLSDGGHNWQTWNRLEPALFSWLNGVLASPGG
ncbi:alpha/beta hydrolase [Flexivirga meconopsidis]|uniref:alpha/beta hydrolase n=1 Tax=Flexivirga meconopsidis TaxID=2977121 RepID=UPI00223EEEE6